MKAFAKFGIDETEIKVGDEIFIHASQKYTATFHGDNYIAWIDRNEDGTINRFATTNYNAVFTENMRIKLIRMEGCEGFESMRAKGSGIEHHYHVINKINHWLASSIDRGLFTPVADMNLAHDEWIAERYS